jgi:hypothetical protein
VENASDLIGNPHQKVLQFICGGMSMGDVFSYKKPALWIAIAVIAVCAVVVLCLLINPKAGDKPEEQYAPPLNRMPEDYSLSDAKNDGCVVFEDGDITSGQSVWASFSKKVNSKETAQVRLVYYYTLGDSSRYAPELYEEIKDDYPVMYIKDLVYDGEGFNIEGYEDGEWVSRRYRYLMKYEGEPRSKWAVFSEYLYYVLTNDESVTWEDIEDGMFSSLMGDQIDHYRVYTDLS